MQPRKSHTADTKRRIDAGECNVDIFVTGPVLVVRQQRFEL